MLYLHNILYGVWAIEPTFANSFIPLIASWIKTGKPPVQPANVAEGITVSSFTPISAEKKAYDWRNWYRERPVEPEKGSVAVINISGAITKHDQYCGPIGMQFYSEIVRRCFNHANIDGIILNIDSGGGEGNAGQLMEETIALRNKPVVAFCNDCTCSAAYRIASAADQIVANNNTARIGSIGTYLTIADYTKQLENEGIRLIEIYADQSKDKNRDYYEAIAGNLAPLKAVVNRYNDEFLSRIRANRPAAAKKETEWNTGKVFFADEALALGLIDSIDSLDNVFNYFS